MLEIKNLHAETEDGNKILLGLDLTVKAGEIHAIMGPNGSGKSTLANILSGREGYVVTEGQVLYNGEDLLALDPEDRACAGLFMAFQYPVEIPGITNFRFLKEALTAQRKKQGLEPMEATKLYEFVQEKMRLVKMHESFLERPVNFGFSGGEKKRNEIMQMAVLEPKLAILDETDSGLDIDALKVVAEGVNVLRSPERAFLLITHYQRLLDYIVPDFIHVLVNGRIVESGDKNLAHQLEKRGYEDYRGDEAGFSRG